MTRNHDEYPDDYIRDILKSVKTIAMLGASSNPMRPSYGVMRFLQGKGYRVIPVNPQIAGEDLHGETVAASLDDIKDRVDMVEVFRRQADIPQVIEDAVKFGAPIIWTQLGLRDDQMAAWAEEQGVKVVMNRCPAIEIPRLGL